jgi:hypothetical protein
MNGFLCTFWNANKSEYDKKKVQFLRRPEKKIIDQSLCTFVKTIAILFNEVSMT